MIQFDEHIFQKGWNHQLDLCWILTRIIPSTAKPRCRFFLASNSVPKSHMLEGNRMLKMNMEPNHGGLVQIIFLSIHGWFVGSSRSSSKVYVFFGTWSKPPKKQVTRMGFHEVSWCRQEPWGLPFPANMRCGWGGLLASKKNWVVVSIMF